LESVRGILSGNVRREGFERNFNALLQAFPTRSLGSLKAGQKTARKLRKKVTKRRADNAAFLVASSFRWLCAQYWVLLRNEGTKTVLWDYIAGQNFLQGLTRRDMENIIDEALGDTLLRKDVLETLARFRQVLPDVPVEEQVGGVVLLDYVLSKDPQ
jgi:hypothetical protein